ncbi:DUF29 domain-containing protein [Candidatus Thiosymbion oneisti]|uniref:DUF29 domain-containing protein n=1 Tax=Candidatus Thiosymbion oneisti TaxID=589554 RepID=UPI000B7E072C|nr:DUF29 domain-containing protein [Candidatus Thiosymbion oneisti]
MRSITSSETRTCRHSPKRLSIQDLLDDNPSLRDILDQQIPKAYRLARLVAVKETDLDEAAFPETCPFSWDEICDEDYLP